MKATEILRKEHRAIELMLDILESACAKLEAGNSVDHQHLEDMTEFLKIFADKRHHGKEEDLLFPALQKAGIPQNGGPVAAMLREHDMGRGYIRGMSQSLAKMKEAGNGAAAVFTDNAQSYIFLLRQHIDKENNILFQIADMHLAEATQIELIKEFDKVEEERIGHGKHEEFHRLIDNLKGIYLS